MLSIITEIFTLQNLLMMNVGLFVGIIIGAMPGLNVALAVTVLLTLSVGMESLPGMFMLLGGYCGAMYRDEGSRLSETALCADNSLNMKHRGSFGMQH